MMHSQDFELFVPDYSMGAEPIQKVRMLFIIVILAIAMMTACAKGNLFVQGNELKIEASSKPTPSATHAIQDEEMMGLKKESLF